MTDSPTPLDWANRLASAVQTRLIDTGHLNDDGTPPAIVIGNPNVGGDGDCGVEVHVDFGPLYATQDPWPFQRQDITATRKVKTNDAAEFTVAVRTCVPVLDEDGNSPQGAARDASVVEVAALGWELHNALMCAAHEWRKLTGYGRIFVDAVQPDPKGGRFAGWNVRVVCPVCPECLG